MQRLLKEAGACILCADHLPLGSRRKRTLTETVRAWHEYLPEFMPLPHPSPRNILWLRQCPWFEREVLPAMLKIVQRQYALGMLMSA